ncbi:MAG TPA: TetR/AcrR family transcriptional regulator [Nocardioidaceae bacterium]|nr:TetR/AcrR family transcriptional regulator [Nocardioidaceae bacterium]
MAKKTREEREELWRSRLDPTYKPRKKPITLERIVETAFAIMAKDGYEALSMRRIAQELGTGPASLYAHVESKAELDRILIDEMAGSFDPPVPDPERWREQVKDVGRAMRTAMNEHAGIARAVMGVVPTSEKAMVAADSMVGILIEGGLHPQVAAWAVDLLPLYVAAVSFEESIQERAGDGRPLEKQEADLVEQLHTFFSSLPPERFPNLTANADVLTTGSGDDRFEFGMSVLVAGLEAVSNSWPEAKPADVPDLRAEA